MKLGAAIHVTRWAFSVLGAAALTWCALTWVGAKRYQSREARRFTKQATVTTAAPPPHWKPVTPPEGGVVGKLDISRIGVSVVVVQGVGGPELSHAVGHIPGTALPGESGNIGLAGHRDTFFRPLRGIRPGDVITLRALHGTYRYRVVSTKVVSPDDVQVLDPSGGDTLTLVTCFPFYYIGSAPKRFIVRADRLPAVEEMAGGISNVQPQSSNF